MKRRTPSCTSLVSGSRTSQLVLLIVLVPLAVVGCNREPAAEKTEPPATAARSESMDAPATASPKPSQASPPTEAPLPERPRIAVGDDPAASLVQVADGVRAAIEGYDNVRRLIYPVGWNRKRTSVLAVRSEIEPAAAPSGNATIAPPTQGSVRLTVRDRYSPIYATREQAAADNELLPRSPMPTREEMLNDRTNPELESVELVVHYEARDGHWFRTGWEGPGKTTRGAQWLDQIGAP